MKDYSMYKTESQEQTELIVSSVALSEETETKQVFEPKKKASLLLAESYTRLNYSDNKIKSVLNCANQLIFAHAVFDENNFDNVGYLKSALFCKDRLCPQCNRRRSLKIYAQMSKIIGYLNASKYRYLSLTLTVRNVAGDELNSTIDRLIYSLDKFFKYKRIAKVVKGYYRALEITYNEDSETYHPHFHILVAVNQSYFAGDSDYYISQSEWLDFWRRAYKDDSIYILDVRPIREKMSDKLAYTTEALLKVVPEFTKYTVKDIPLYCDRVVQVLSSALYNRRLIAFAGCFKEAFQKLKLDDAESDNADLICYNDTPVSESILILCTVYNFRAGIYNRDASYIVNQTDKIPSKLRLKLNQDKAYQNALLRNLNEN